MIDYDTTYWTDELIDQLAQEAIDALEADRESHNDFGGSKRLAIEYVFYKAMREGRIDRNMPPENSQAIMKSIAKSKGVLQ